MVKGTCTSAMESKWVFLIFKKEPDQIAVKIIVASYIALKFITLRLLIALQHYYPWSVGHLFHIP